MIKLSETAARVMARLKGKDYMLLGSYIPQKVQKDEEHFIAIGPIGTRVGVTERGTMLNFNNFARNNFNVLLAREKEPFEYSYKLPPGSSIWLHAETYYIGIEV